jgi:hypothetical protein
MDTQIDLNIEENPEDCEILISLKSTTVNVYWLGIFSLSLTLFTMLFSLASFVLFLQFSHAQNLTVLLTQNEKCRILVVRWFECCVYLLNLICY